MQPVNWENITQALRKYVLNKYVLTLLIFAVIFIFVGDQSLLNGIKRGHKIHQIEQNIHHAEEATKVAKLKISSLQHPDSLERYAREHYLMHKDNEDVFLIEE